MPAMSNDPARSWVLAASCLAGLTLLTGCGKKQATEAPPPPHVGVITLHDQSVMRTTDLPGRTAAVMTADIRPQVSGVILRRLFVEGGDVKAGQQLYQIDPALYKAAYDSALAAIQRSEASLATDQALATRYKALVGAQAVSKQEYDNAAAAVLEDKANIASAKAQLETSRINLAYTEVFSPIDGTIGASSVTPGALVTADQSVTLTTVTQLDPIYVDVNEPINTWLRLKREAESGQLETAPDGSAKVTLQLGDGSSYGHVGKMQFSEVNVDQTTGTVLVRALFPNPQHLLLPGMYVHAVINEGMIKDAILVPQQAVSRNVRGDAVVMVVDKDNVVVQKVIQTDRTIGNDWLLTSGLQPGERVIVAGLGNIRPGEKVTPIEETPTASSAS